MINFGICPVCDKIQKKMASAIDKTKIKAYIYTK